MNKYDKKHLQDLQTIGKRIERIFIEATKEAARIGARIDQIDPERLFSFDDYPSTKKEIDKLLSELASSVDVAIVNGIESAWTLANNKNNELCNTVFGDNVAKLSQDQYRRYYSTNHDAMVAFRDRKQKGLNLSDRVWRYTDTFKREIELGLDVGIRNGLSAQEMAAELKQWLKYPDMLFRRVRDEHGNLQLSKRASLFHPGQGVYRSSYMNARRLAATETNIAYRTADHERWQQLDFVVGIRVVLSNNHTCLGRDGKPHPFEDICDQLSAEYGSTNTTGRGCYPKDFKFTGWHPHCRCHAESILKTDEEIAEDNRRILRGEDPISYKESDKYVKDVPEEFEEWVKDNSLRIIKANKLPYFMTDNKKYVVDYMSEHQPSTMISGLVSHEQFKAYSTDFRKTSDKVDQLFKQLQECNTDIGKAMLINQIKQECANLTVQNLRSSSMIGEDWVPRNEFNSMISKKEVCSVGKKIVTIPETIQDILVFKDKSGMEFAYPIGANTSFFNAVVASESIDAFPPYLKAGIKRVSFLDIPCPYDPYWRVKYNNPNHVSMATDGGKTTFFMAPKSKEAFTEVMAHEAGHIIDGVKHMFSSSKSWQDAVAKDNEIFKSYHVKMNRVSRYAQTNDAEDFAECMKSYITDHDYFKQCFPNRAAFIRSMAQRLSSRLPK